MRRALRCTAHTMLRHNYSQVRLARRAPESCGAEASRPSTSRSARANATGFDQTWIHARSVNGRAVPEEGLSLSSLAHGSGARANRVGGVACDGGARFGGVSWPRREDDRRAPGDRVVFGRVLDDGQWAQTLRESLRAVAGEGGPSGRRLGSVCDSRLSDQPRRRTPSPNTIGRDVARRSVCACSAPIVVIDLESLEVARRNTSRVAHRRVARGLAPHVVRAALLVAARASARCGTDPSLGRTLDTRRGESDRAFAAFTCASDGAFPCATTPTRLATFDRALT